MRVSWVAAQAPGGKIEVEPMTKREEAGKRNLLSRGTQNPDSGRWGAFLAAKARTEEGAWQSKPGLSVRIEISN